MFNFLASIGLGIAMLVSVYHPPIINNAPIVHKVIETKTEPPKITVKANPIVKGTKIIVTPQPTPVEPNPVVTPLPVPEVDFCKNISGNQLSVPSGMQVDENGNCFVIVTPPQPIPTSTPIYVVQPSPTPDPAQMYKDCSNAYQTAYQEVIASGSTGNANQMRALTRNRMTADGFGYCSYLY